MSGTKLSSGSIKPESERGYLCAEGKHTNRRVKTTCTHIGLYGYTGHWFGGLRRETEQIVHIVEREETELKGSAS